MSFTHIEAPYGQEKAALAAVSDEDLLAAFAAAWARSSQRKPRWSAKRLRKEILASWSRRLDVSPTRLLTPGEAAFELGVHRNTITNRASRGELETKRFQNGTLAIVVPDERPRRWSIIPTGPDPRLG